MGADKAALDFGVNETMLLRTVRILSQIVPLERIVCVGAPGQSLPSLPVGVRIAFDPVIDGGPLVGLAAGFDALARVVDVVYVSGCDTPLIAPAFVSRMFDLLGDEQIVAPHDGERWHPLAAVYRTEVRTTIETLLANQQRSLSALLEACHARRLPVDALRDVDPHLLSLKPCNTPNEYQAALQLAALH
jgi:molybdopterin-guanine dinucleotide biosynthesis protein A